MNSRLAVNIKKKEKETIRIIDLRKAISFSKKF